MPNISDHYLSIRLNANPNPLSSNGIWHPRSISFSNSVPTAPTSKSSHPNLSAINSPKKPKNFSNSIRAKRKKLSSYFFAFFLTSLP